MHKTVLITGASGGIGQAISKAFAHAGYRVVMHYFSGEKQARNLQQKLHEAGCDAWTVQADLSDPKQIQQMFHQVDGVCGEIDVLVNNAGCCLQKVLQDVSLKEWQHLFSVNVSGMFLCTQQLLPSMIARQNGRIINISSMWGITGASCETAYSATKAAVIGLTKSLAKEVGPSGITVNCVAPGLIQTDMNTTLDQDTLQALLQQTPLGRIGTPEDVANAVLFLSSGQAGFITGEVLNVNGGMLI